MAGGAPKEKINIGFVRSCGFISLSFSVFAQLTLFYNTLISAHSHFTDVVSKIPSMQRLCTSPMKVLMIRLGTKMRVFLSVSLLCLLVIDLINDPAYLTLSKTSSSFSPMPLYRLQYCGERGRINKRAR